MPLIINNNVPGSFSRGFTAANTAVRGKQQQEATNQQNAITGTQGRFTAGLDLLKQAKMDGLPITPAMIETVRRPGASLNGALEAAGRGGIDVDAQIQLAISGTANPEQVGAAEGAQAGASTMAQIPANVASAEAIGAAETGVQVARTEALSGPQAQAAAATTEAVAGVTPGKGEVALSSFDTMVEGLTARGVDANTAESIAANTAFNLPAENQPEFIDLLARREDLLRRVNAGDQSAQQEMEFVNGRLLKMATASGFSVTTNPDGTTTVNFGQQQKGLTAQQQQTVDERVSYIKQGKSIVLTLLEKGKKDPSLFGALGTVRKGAQTAASVGGDLASVLADTVGIDVQGYVDTAKNLASGQLTSGEIDLDAMGEIEGMFDPTLDQMALLENALAFSLARTLQPTGRLLAETIKTARKQTKLTGMAGSDQVMNRLRFIDDLLSRAEAGITQPEQTKQRLRYNPDSGELEDISNLAGGSDAP